jgi:hypothetical protein
MKKSLIPIDYYVDIFQKIKKIYLKMITIILMFIILKNFKKQVLTWVLFIIKVI